MKKLVSVIIAIFIFFAFSGCSSNDNLVGSYITNQGTTLTIEKDGKGYYGESDEDGSGTAEWWIEGDTLYVTSEVLGYEIYADISGDTSSLYFEAKDSRWSPEVFLKTNN